MWDSYDEEDDDTEYIEFVSIDAVTDKARLNEVSFGCLKVYLL